MVLKRFAAVPGSIILGAPQATGKRSCSLPFLSLLQKTSSWSHWLPQRQERTGKTHSLMFFVPPPNCFCLSAEAQLNTSDRTRLSSQVPIWHKYNPPSCLLVPARTRVIRAPGFGSHSPQTKTTLLLTTPEDGTQERASQHAPVLNPRHTQLPAGQSSAQSTSTCFWRP